MGVLENGLWQAKKTAEQLSREDTFSGELIPEAGRYHLYVSGACPFAHRPWLVIRMLGLDDVITVSSVAAVRHDRGWEFSAEYPDPCHNNQYLSELYVQSDHHFTGRVSVPVLWDRHENKIVCNDSARMATAFATKWLGLARYPHELIPVSQATDVAEMNGWLHKNINRRVYMAGFATTQSDYDREVNVLFDALDAVEDKLGSSTYLLGQNVTLPDLFLLPTLVRFETVYAVHFRANKVALTDYPSLYRYMLNLLTQRPLRETVHMRHIMAHYYLSHRHINPFGVIPVGPRPDWVNQYGLMS